MRFGLIHRIMTDALAVLGLLSLLTSGELEPLMTGAIVVGLLVALTMPERWQSKPVVRHAGVVVPLVLLATQLTRLFTGGALLPLAVEFAAGLQVVRLGTRRGAAHDQQVIVLALLHLIAGTVLGGGLAYGLCFVGFLIVAPGALVLSHLRREVEGNYRQGARDRTGLPVDVPRILRSRRVIGKQFLVFTCLLSVPIFLFTATLFVLFPRVGLSLLLLNHGKKERMVGFSDRVDLGGIGRLRSDPTIAMRVEYPNLPEDPPQRLALYLRGTAFDQYDGRSWSRTLTERTPASKIGNRVILRPNAPAGRKLTIELEPIDPPVVFVPGDAVALRVLPRGDPLLGGTPTIYRGPENELKYSSSDDRGLRYEVHLAGVRAPPGARLTAADRMRYLSLPPNVNERMRVLARDWTRDSANPEEMARAVEQRLRHDYSYDLESPSGATSNPLDHFLFESKRGHCEYYSTAMAVLLRTVGVPTRNVNGFIGGTYNRFGRFYAVRQGDAHSWVEAWIDGRGWVRFDPTPPGDAAPQSEIKGVLAFFRDLVEASARQWNHHVVGYDLKQQVSFLSSVRRSMSSATPGVVSRTLSSPRRTGAIVVGLALLGFAAWWWRRERKNPGRKKKLQSPREVHSRRATELYESLQQALVARGVPRPPSTPPLAHARGLLEAGHPIGEEVMDLTLRYLGWRFGGVEVTSAERDDFVARVKAIRSARDASSDDSKEAAA